LGAFSVHICGISILAVGDAIASIIGVNFGRHKWPGSTKSLEGSAGAFIGTWICLLIVEQFREIGLGWRRLLRLALPALIGAFDEAVTSQIDNLTLPFVMIPHIVMTSYLLE
jgi:dolichol kinase